MSMTEIGTLTRENLADFLGPRSDRRSPTSRHDRAAAVQPPVDLGRAPDDTPILRAVPPAAAVAYSIMEEHSMLRPPCSRPVLDAGMIGYRGSYGMPYMPDDPCNKAVALLSPPERPSVPERAPAELVPTPARGSIPNPDAVMDFLGRATRMTDDEIRAVFRPGRRSAEQRAARTVVEEAILALFRRHTVGRHPAAGTRQRRQARSAWWNMCPGGEVRWQRNKAAVGNTYGTHSYADRNDHESQPILDGAGPWKEWRNGRPHEDVQPPRYPRKRGRPVELLTESVCEALHISDRTVRRIREVSTPDA